MRTKNHARSGTLSEKKSTGKNKNVEGKIYLCVVKLFSESVAY